MEEVKTAVAAVCALSAVRCVMNTAAGGSKLKGQFAMLLDLMIAIVIISPIAAGLRDFQLPELTVYELPGYSDELYRQTLAEETARNIGDVLMAQITASGISCSNIEVEVNISADNSISITKVTVTSEDIEAAAGIIYNTLGRETEVEAIVE